MLTTMLLALFIALFIAPAPERSSVEWVVEPLEMPGDDTARCPTLTSHGDSLFAGWVETDDAGVHSLRWANGNDLSASTEEAAREVIDRVRDQVDPDGDGVTWLLTGTIASGSDWFVNWADVPTVHFTGRCLIAAFLQRLGSDTYAYGIRWVRPANRSLDATCEDDNWAQPEWLHDDRSPTEHGFVSFAALGEGRTSAFWLDGRAMVPSSDGHGRGAMTLRGAVIGNDGQRGPELVLDERVCECCPTAATALSASRVAVAYRDRSESEVRDVAVLCGDVDTGVFERSELAGDGWEIAGCPVNGPALASSKERVALAWYTGANDRSSVRLAVSNDSAKTFAEPVEVSLGNSIGRAEVIFVDDETILVVWAEHLPERGASWMGRAYDAALQPGEPFRIGAAEGDRRAGYAALAPFGDGALVVWTDGASGQGLLGARIVRAESADERHTQEPEGITR